MWSSAQEIQCKASAYSKVYTYSAAALHLPNFQFLLLYIHMMRQGYAENVSNASELPMLDLVLAVEDSEAWHKANLER